MMLSWKLNYENHDITDKPAALEDVVDMVLSYDVDIEVRPATKCFRDTCISLNS